MQELEDEYGSVEEKARLQELPFFYPTSFPPLVQQAPRELSRPLCLRCPPPRHVPAHQQHVGIEATVKRGAHDLDEASNDVARLVREEDKSSRPQHPLDLS
eukprot:768759-Hanusia_phi.AAC.12